MLLPRLAATVLLVACTAIASSVARNPLNKLGEISNPSIDTQSHRITAFSNFDLSFTAYHRRIKLTLEPNHDILSHAPEVRHLDADGHVVWTEPIDRLAHKVFKGEAWWQNLDGSWSRVGWARITVHQDGIHPLFEGAFTVHRDHHHIQLAANYRQTKHRLDPWAEDRDDEHMVVFRDSDIAAEDPTKAELKERGFNQFGGDWACQADRLEFNMDPQHPIFMGPGGEGKSVDNSWGSMSFGSLFGKRQIDSSTGAGNTGSVNLVSTIGSTNGCPNTRRIALVGVAYDCSYSATFNSTSSANANVITQINTASSLYESTFNITLGLANLTSNDANCPSTPPSSAQWNVPCSNSVNLQDRLNLFSQWRSEKQDNNSHWTLLTDCNTGAEIGLAWLGQACIVGVTSRNSSGGAQTVAGANVVARTSTEWQVIAHETGHTFGAVHDCTSQTCSDGTSTAQQCCPLSSTTCDAQEKYIMNPSTAQGITNFSPCSVGNICSAMGSGSVKTNCLTDNKGVLLSTGPVCGNGIVEPGEQCDCGGASGCGNDTCCDPTTCKYTSGSVCDDANDECCNKCQLAPAGQVCRASTGVCDPQEVCSGNSSSCPADKMTPNGQSCGNGLTCASGQCTSRDQQCKTLMGSYTSGNDTYACDSEDCTLSCASPQFGTGVCYGLQQNFLDGTPCGGGGQCANGQCKGSNFGKEIGSWIQQHKGLVIGVAAGIGGLLLFMIASAIWRFWQRRRYFKKISNGTWPNSAGGWNPQQQQGQAALGQPWLRGPKPSPGLPGTGWNPQMQAPMGPPPYRGGSVRYM